MTATGREDRRRLRLGILASEFFAPEIGRLGGFGWAASRVARLFNGDSSLGVDVTFIAAAGLPGDAADLRVHDTPVIAPGGQAGRFRRRLRDARLDLILSIDYRPKFRRVLGLLPRTPIVVWVRDPHTAEDSARIASLRVPGADGVRAAGARAIDCRSLRRVAFWSRLSRRPVLVATTSPHLIDKIPGAYGVHPVRVDLLPNPIDLTPGVVIKDSAPRAAFLARLDPVKRPWLVLDLARRLPHVAFVVMGDRQAVGPGAWRPAGAPQNVRLLGHVGRDTKTGELSASRVLVNTAVHEGLAVSFLESLQCETPLVSAVDPAGLVSRFGIRASQADGDGRAALPSFEAAIRRLLDDDGRRRRLGREGRRWVEETHTAARFLAAFDALCSRLGLARAARRH